MTDTTTKAEAVREYMRHANGSNTFERHWTKALASTDGVRFVADTCGAHWLIDAVASHQFDRKVRGEEFQVWTLKTKGAGDRWNTPWRLECEDGNGGRVTAQGIPFSDFPEELAPFRLFLEGGVLMLPCER